MNERVVVGADGKPAERSGKCPECKADRDKRVSSSGFGAPHDVCGQCGHEFEESTL